MSKRPPRRRWHSGRTLWLGLTCWFLAVGEALPAQDATSYQALTLPALDREYLITGLTLPTMARGPLQLTPRVPQGQLELISHQIQLRPRTDRTFDLILEVTLSGQGTLDAELALLAAATSLRDDVTLPPQTLRLPAQIRLEWRDDGLAVTVLELPSAIELRVESALGQRLVGSCRTLAVLGSPACDGLANSLDHLRVPLDATGSTYLIPRAWIDERAGELLHALVR